MCAWAVLRERGSTTCSQIARTVINTRILNSSHRLARSQLSQRSGTDYDDPFRPGPGIARFESGTSRRAQACRGTPFLEHELTASSDSIAGRIQPGDSLCRGTPGHVVREAFQRSPGFDKENLVAIEVVSKDVSTAGDRARIAGNELLDRVRSTPGVVAAAFSRWALFSGSGGTNRVRIPGKEPESFEPHFLPVSPGFFETMRIRTVEGRTFNENDFKPERPTAVIINEAFARRYFANEPALGRVYERVDRENLVRQEIVGIVADARYGGTLRQPAPPTAYLPLRDIGSLMVRTTRHPLLMVPTLQREIGKANSSLRI